MDKTFYNEKRNRYYGIRIGDRVRHVATDPAGEKKIVLEGTVEEYGLMDNNSVRVRNDKDGILYSVVAEWLIILRPIEQWFSGKTADSIVTLDPFGQPETSQETLDHYGGYVIAESVPPPFRNIILAAPDLLKALQMFDQLDRTGQITIWSDKRAVMNRAFRIAEDGKDEL